MPDNQLPDAIKLRDGRLVTVIWTSLGTGWAPGVDEFEPPRLVEYYFPSPSTDYLYPDIAIDLMYNIHHVDMRTGETSIVDETALPSLGIDPQDLYLRASYISVAEQLMQQGSLTEAQLTSPDVQNYLITRSETFGRDPTKRGAAWQNLAVEVERIAADPAFAQYMRGMGAMGPISPEERATMGGDVMAQNIAGLIRTRPSGETETEWLQDIVGRLGRYYEEYTPRAGYATGLMAQTIPALKETYETAQARLVEIEAGAEQATKFEWMPSQYRVMTAQFGYEPPTAPLGVPLSEVAMKRKLTPWDKLVTEARPERIARL